MAAANGSRPPPGRAEKVARIAQDEDLYRAACQLVDARRQGQPDRSAVAQVAGLVQQRLSKRAVI